MKILQVLLISLLAAPIGWAATLVLREEAYVKGGKVLLRDVAEIEEGDFEALGEIELASAPLPGTSKTINAAMIEARVRSAGVEEFQVTGARTVRTHTLSRDISKEELAESLRQHIMMEMPWDSAETEVDVPLPLNNVVVPEGSVEIEWRSNPQYRFVGPGAFRGTIKIDGEVQKTLLCKATVEAYAEVVVAAKDIPRGKILSTGDVQLVKQAISRLPNGAVWDPAELVGLVTKRTVFAGQPVTPQHVEQRQVIQRNQEVPVVLRSGALNLQTRARAMNDARVGELVVCANLKTKEQFQGIVGADGVVVVE